MHRGLRGLALYQQRCAVQGLQEYLGIAPESTLHVGDQFLNTGNDWACRDACPTLWITSPDETKNVRVRSTREKEQLCGTIHHRHSFPCRC